MTDNTYCAPAISTLQYLFRSNATQLLRQSSGYSLPTFADHTFYPFALLGPPSSFYHSDSGRSWWS